MRILLGLSLLALAACGSSEEKAVIGDVTVSNNEDAGTATIESKTGSLQVINGAEADKVTTPAFAPKYPGSVFDGAMISTKKDKGVSTTLNFTTTDSMAQIGAFYREQLPAQGLTISMNMVTEDVVMINAEGPGKTVSVMAGVTDGKLGGVLSFTGE